MIQTNEVGGGIKIIIMIKIGNGLCMTIIPIAVIEAAMRIMGGISEKRIARGKLSKLAPVIIGKNVPPFHPVFCRIVVIAIFKMPATSKYHQAMSAPETCKSLTHVVLKTELMEMQQRLIRVSSH